MSVSALPPAIEPGSRIAGMPDPVASVEYSLGQVSEALFGRDGPGFKDVLTAINPLQHLPVIGTIYRYLTGDTISPGSRMAGGLLYGGPIGLIGAAVNAALEGSTGKDIGDHVLAMVVDDPRKPPPAPAASPVQVASAAPTPESSPAPVEPQAAVGPAVTANPVAPVATAAAAAAPPTPPPPAGGATPLTPEAYARAMAAANGRSLPAMPVRAGAPPMQQPGANGVPELSNEAFARLLGAFEPAAGGTDAAAAAATPPAPPPNPVPIVAPDYRPGRNNPYITRGNGRYFSMGR
jgi:hypothetical protein